MEMKRTGIFENGLIWFGAAVSWRKSSREPISRLWDFRGAGSYPGGTSHRLRVAFPFRRHRRQCQKERHGERKNEFRTKGQPAVCHLKCIAAGGMDGHHDL